MSSFLNETFRKFFIELAKNNHKDWFDLNRERYHKDVKTPFENIVKGVISQLRESEDLGSIEAKDCLFRINRDIRFSKDKTPYKLHLSAAVSKYGKKDFENPSFYFEIGPEYINIYSGIYQPNKISLNNIRQYISKYPKELDELLSNQKFKTNFGNIQGEKAKRLPSDLNNTHSILFNKQFYIHHQIETKNLIDKDIVKYLVTIFNSAQPINQYLKKAIDYDS
jgi:uncharacterized protein (TIGR02453 family)